MAPRALVHMRSWSWPILLALAVLPLYILTAAPTLSSRNGGDDGGDLAVAAAALGVAHPAGYPLYILLGWLWIHVVGLGDVAYRLNLFSAACAAAAVGAAGWACCELIWLTRPNARRLPAALAAAGASLLLAFSQPLWGQAVVISVYTLNLAFAAALLGIIIRAQRLGPSARGAALLGLLLGIGLGNHLTLAFVGCGAAAVAARRRWPLRVWLAAAACAAIGAMAVYSYLLAGNVESRDPVGAWGDPSSLPGFAALTSGQLYHGLIGRPPLGQVGQRLLHSASLTVGVLTPVGVAAAALGVADAFRLGVEAIKGSFLAASVVAATSLAFAVTYGGARGEHHLLLVYLALTPIAAVGLSDVLGQARKGWIGALGLALLCLLGFTGWSSRGVIAAGDTSAVALARQRLESQPPNGVLYSESDADTFALWYAQEDLGRRPDVAVVHVGLWQASRTYRAKLLARHPGLRIDL